jgi:hypothetical protein
MAQKAAPCHYCEVSAALYTGSPNERQVGQNGR